VCFFGLGHQVNLLDSAAFDPLDYLRIFQLNVILNFKEEHSSWLVDQIADCRIILIDILDFSKLSALI